MTPFVDTISADETHMTPSIQLVYASFVVSVDILVQIDRTCPKQVPRMLTDSLDVVTTSQHTVRFVQLWSVGEGGLVRPPF